LWFNKKAFSQISNIDMNLWSYRQKGQIPLSIIYDYEKFIMLKSIDDRWRDHLHEIDNLKEAIHLRSYGGKDVNVEFKKEAYELFMDMIDEIDSRILSSIFDTIKIDEADAKKIEKIESMSTRHEELEAFHAQGIPEGDIASKGEGIRARPQAAKAQPVRTGDKIGRNDPCPCGSGKKYKKCCGRNVN
jgi:preprotein translocase subunit SecA